MISIPQSRRSFLIPVTLIIGAVLLTRLPTLFLSVVDWDETAYALVARDWLHGMWPGVGSFDHKPVALDAVFALVIAAGGDTPVATRMISLLFVGGGALLLHRLLRRELDATPALLLALGFVLASCGYSGMSSNSEHIVNFYLIAWLAVWRYPDAPSKRGAALCGIVAGLAVQTNYLAVPLVIALYLAAVIAKRPRPWLMIGLSLLLSVATFLAFWLLLYWGGSLGPYLRQQVEFLSIYRLHPSLGDAISTIFANGGALLVPTAFAGFLGWRRRLGGNDRLIFLMIVAAGISIFQSGRFYAHYFLLLLPALVLWTGAVTARATNPRRAALLFLAAFAVGALPGLRIAVRGLAVAVEERRGGLIAHDGSRQAMRDFGGLIAPRSSAYVVCAEPVLYQLFDLQPVTRYQFWVGHLRAGDLVRPGLVPRDEVARILARRPAFVIFGNQCRPDERAIVNAALGAYRLIKSANGVSLLTPLPRVGGWQGQGDSNPRPSVLETDALPTELYP